MNKELLGLGLTVALKNDFEEGFPNEYTRFGYTGSETLFTTNVKHVVDFICRRFEEYTEAEESFVTGYPFNVRTVPGEPGEVLKDFQKSIREFCTQEAINNAIQKVLKSGKPLTSEFDSKSYLRNGESFGFKYHITLYPIYGGGTSCNIVPTKNSLEIK